jgi:uncharacterized membrane protein
VGNVTTLTITVAVVCGIVFSFVAIIFLAAWLENKHDGKNY